MAGCDTWKTMNFVWCARRYWSVKSCGVSHRTSSGRCVLSCRITSVCVPSWLLRLGLFIYDHLGGRNRLPPTRTLNLRNDPAGAALKPEFTRGFAYSDCWVEDSRLVLLNACDAAERGATIAPRTACVSAERSNGRWIVTLSDGATGQRRMITREGPGQRGWAVGGRGCRFGDPRRRGRRPCSSGQGQPHRGATAV